MEREGLEPVLEKKTRFPERVKGHMKGKEVSEGVARDLVARELVAERAEERAKKFKKLSLIDALTGLPNKRFLLGDENSHPSIQGELQRVFARAKRHRRQFTLAVWDLDDFKMYNDTYGHPAGDQALREFARILQETIRESDVAARYGGEEFVVILPETDGKAALEVVERLRQELKGSSPLFKKPVTASIGLATFPHPEIESAEDLLKAADKVLLQAKNQGKNQVVTAWEKEASGS